MRRSPLQQGKALQRSPLKPRTDAPRKPRRAISPASVRQRVKVRDAVSIVSGEHGCDPAHLWPRSRGGCSHPDCVVPLTRAEHRAFDDGKLDVLPYVLAHGLWVELAHMVSAHQVDPISLLQRLTGDRYLPEREAA